MAAKNVPDIKVTYKILRQWAQRRLQRTHTDLAIAYAERTKDYIEPGEVWEDTLGEINRRLERHKLPPLAGIVIQQESNQPSYDFWGSCLRTSVPLANAEARRLEYGVILKEIFSAAWPPEIP